jgi:hypothetical protein
VNIKRVHLVPAVSAFFLVFIDDVGATNFVTILGLGSESLELFHH